MAFNDQKNHDCYHQIQSLKDDILTQMKSQPTDKEAIVQNFKNLNLAQKEQIKSLNAQNHFLKEQLTESETKFKKFKDEIGIKINQLCYEPYVCNYKV